MSRFSVYLLGATLFLSLGGHDGSEAQVARDWPKASAPALSDVVPVSDSDVLTPRGSLRCPASDPSSDPSDPATTSSLPRGPQFVVRDHFREDSSSQAEVSIAWLGAMFIQQFLDKIEDEDDGAVVRAFVLREAARDTQILDALDNGAETQLGDLWCLLKRQPKGESGTLLTQAAPNVFYIRDVQGIRRAVDAVWNGAGWEIGASTIGPNRWLAGRQVFSR